MRRVAGYHDIRLDGISDLLSRCRGATVMDIGCNRGLVGFEFANNGARIVHGCDSYEDGITVARHLFCDLRNCESQFEVVDLSKGPDALKPFGDGGWDIVVMLATYHKLRRIMKADELAELMKFFGRRTLRYFAWRGTDKPDENQIELKELDQALGDVKLSRVHTSALSKQIGMAAIWEKS
jgi:hypothetical protein